MILRTSSHTIKFANTGKKILEKLADNEVYNI